MDDHMLLGRRRLLPWTLLAITLAWILVEGVWWPAGPIGAIDRRWAELMTALRWAPAVSVAIVFDVVGGPVVATAIRVGVAIAFAAGRRWRAMWLWIASAVAAQAVSTLLKVWFAHPRPEGALVATISSSFPSGHTTNAAAMAVALVLVLTARGTGERRLAVALAALAVVAMAWSRTYLLVHWLGDVVGGALIGVTATLLVAVAMDALARRRTG